MEVVCRTDCGGLTVIRASSFLAPGTEGLAISSPKSNSATLLAL